MSVSDNRCPSCGREARDWAFHTSNRWLRCPLGHVFDREAPTEKESR